VSNPKPRSASGRTGSSPFKLPFATWKDVAICSVKESSADNIGLVSAGVAFYGFLAMVPLLAATVLTYGLAASPETVLRHMQSLTSVLPADIAMLIGEQLMNVVTTSGGKKGLGVATALAIALFGARNAAGAIVTALNIAYDLEETRGFIKVTLLALAITAAAVAGVVLAMVAIGAMGFLQQLVPGGSPVLVALGKAVSYLMLALVAAAGAATLYRYAPAHKDARWTWITPGSALFAVVWTLLTLGFGFYVSRFGNYGATYGSLSAVVVLLTWLYLSSYALLIGGELNSEFEHRMARDGAKGTPSPAGEVRIELAH
jgi:membrane protein